MGISGGPLFSLAEMMDVGVSGGPLFSLAEMMTVDHGGAVRSGAPLAPVSHSRGYLGPNNTHRGAGVAGEGEEAFGNPQITLVPQRALIFLLLLLPPKRLRGASGCHHVHGHWNMPPQGASGALHVTAVHARGREAVTLTPSLGLSLNPITSVILGPLHQVPGPWLRGCASPCGP